MSRRHGALRWYPERWRHRYGDELAALLEEAYGDGPLPLRGRLSLVRSGLAERGRQAVGGPAGPPARLRSGSLVVLAAWVVFVVAGAAFAKFAEHWDRVTPASGRTVPARAYTTVQWAGLVGTLIVVVGAVLCLPALVRLTRQGGWPRIRRPLVRAGSVSAATVVLGAAFVLWAHRLSGPARNGGSWPFAGAGALVVLLICTSLVLFASATAAVVPKLELGRQVLRAEGVLALALTLAMTVVCAGTIAWWVAMAQVAPGFLAGGPVSWPGTPAPATLLVAGFLMVAGLGTAGAGAWRVVRSLGPVPHPPDPGP